MMNQDLPVEFILPPEFRQEHHDALIAYLMDERALKTAVWRQLYRGIDLLDNAQVATEQMTQTFRQAYDALIGRSFASRYIERLLETDDVLAESAQLAAHFARQVRPLLQEAGLLSPAVPYSILLQGYCLYWWQSFARGYAFEVYIMRDLSNEGIAFQMHDIRDRIERYSPADLVVLDLLGDIKTSIYFLQHQLHGQLPNDFYITRLYAKGRERTLVVFQKPYAWDTIGGGSTISGTLEAILDLLPSPVQIRLHGIILIVIDYETWKQLVRQKQPGEGT